MRIKCNNIPREVKWDESGRHYFTYRGSDYYIDEFEVASDDFKSLGFDGIQTESYFSAVIVKWFDKDGNMIEDGDAIIVGYAHW